MRKAWNSLPNKSIGIRKFKNNKNRRVIKINGKWIRNARYVYEQNFRPLRPGEDVHHKDEDTLNDDPDNLEALTKGKHIIRHIDPMFGEDNPYARFTKREVKEMFHRYYWVKNITHRELAILKGVSYTCIYHLLSGHTYNPEHKAKEQLIRESRIIRTPV